MIDVEAFCKKFGMPTPDQPTLHDVGLALHRVGLIQEELIEYETNLKLALTVTDLHERNQYLEEMVDALADIIYATIGTAIIHGFDIMEALREVHRANMEKEAGFNPKRGHACDVIKPPGWKPPKHHIGRRGRTGTKSGPSAAGSSTSSSESAQLSLWPEP